ncbi:Mrp/NBP35 family ATP-binding protein [Coxiella endosymbiont of Amblyomma nuttalli]|uniref:Mrp/NBP35 family ATP-binding protein n=1 Tax=Coxiella endosymbiont of Amblyomma nuttalli TaxID=2749996 RepID=UPI001BADCE82|nr:Mrp/NBP35 family ATP-binding protein [Coxiella endosymbiont of Amblyomma nuttalli]QTS84201.1 Septum site-determining protein MinD [Coxiella endosymbiont of Amblyomma nuttalli]
MESILEKLRRRAISAHAVQAGQKGIQEIKNIITVASGKGGVGKSTTAVNLALALSGAGAQVGLLDADIHGPNQPLMLGIREKFEIQSNKKLIPIRKYGIQSSSIGYLINPKTPMIWRGPMVSQALQQLLYDTLWKDLDFLILDLPPGTGDAPLTLAKRVPIAGAVIVTTPQDVSLLDAGKALSMFKKLGITVLGIIENMAIYVCPHCGQEDAIFGSGGGKLMATENHIPLLGQIPLNGMIRKNTDAGTPIIFSDPTSLLANYYREIAFALVEQLSLQPINYAIKFPDIVVEGTK